MTDYSAMSDADLAVLTGMQPPAPSSGGDNTLSVQNNNPGNMKGANGDFVSYDSPKAGLAAMQHDLSLKVSGQSPIMKSQYGDGYKPTLRNVISTWAPPSENDTGNYIDFVSKHAGIDPDQPLTEADIPKVMQPMIHMEGGQKASSYFGKLMQGLGDAVAPPAQAGEGAPAAAPTPTPAAPDYSAMSDADLAVLTGMQPPSIAQDVTGNLEQTAIRSLTGKDSLPETGLGVANAVAQPVFNAATNAVKSAIPSSVANAVQSGAQDTANAIDSTNIGQGAGDLLLRGKDALNKLFQNNPRVARDLGEVGNVMAVGGTAEAAKTALASVAPGAKALLKDTFGGAPPLSEAAPSLLKMDEPPPPPPGGGGGSGGGMGAPPAAPPAAPLLVSAKSVESAPGKLGDYLEADGIDLNKTADHLEELQKTDPNARAIDAITQGEGDIPGGMNVRALLKSISQTPGQARTMVAQMISRGRNAASDIGDWVTQSLGAGDYATQKAGLAAQMKASGGAYAKAYANPVKMTSPAIGDLLARPAGQKALANAQALAANEGASINNLDGTLNTQGIDYVKRALDDMINGQEGSGNFGKMTQAGRGFLEVKNGLLQEADNLNPDFKAARTQFADPASQMQALEQGRNFFRMSKGDIASFMAGKSPAEKAQFASGVSEAVQEKVGVRDNSNPINKVWNENNRGRFRALFPDDASYQQFAKGMDLHQVKMDVNQTMAGSPTFQNQAFDSKPVSGAVGNGIRAASDPLQFLGGKLADFADKALAQNAAKLDSDSKTMITRILTTKDPQALRAVAARVKPVTIH